MAGELIETAWAEANNIRPSTREMTPGHRHDVLNDLYDFWNWWKVTQMGEWTLSIHSLLLMLSFTVVTLKHQLTEAKKQLTKKRDFFDRFCDLFGERAVKWSGESTNPILINGEWTSVYKPKISSCTFTFAYPLS